MTTRNSVLKQVAELPRLTFDQLKARWRELYGNEPPPYNKAHLVQRLAYRVQELAYGGLSETAQAVLQEGNVTELDGNMGRQKRRARKQGMPVPGTTLVREWSGKRYEVTVVEGGFEYAGKPYRSLSAVTNAITGTHWNGPDFFGLRKRKD